MIGLYVVAACALIALTDAVSALMAGGWIALWGAFIVALIAVAIAEYAFVGHRFAATCNTCERCNGVRP